MTIEARFTVERDNFRLNIDILIPSTGVTTIFGPSGCGKTTLLRAIAGLETATKGYLKVGDDIWQDSKRFLAPHKRPIGYVFQEPSLFAHLNVECNLQYGLKRAKKHNQNIALDRVIDLLGIGHLLRRMPYQLSGGEQQRVAIARALAVSPTMLLLDEPLAALDQQRKQEILPYLESLHQELDMPVLYISHSRSEVARLADHMIYLTDGRVRATGTVRELFSRLDLPLAHEPDAKSVIETVVVGHDKAYNLNYLDFDGGRFVVPHKPLALGRKVRLQVFVRDISITLSQQDKTSILNTFPATVTQLADENSGQVALRLMLGSFAVLARITRKSVVNLKLKPGSTVYVQIKSVALMC